MYKTISFLILLMIFGQVQAQKTITIPNNRYDWGFYARLPEELDKLQLRDLTQSKNTINIRIWNRIHVIDIGKSQGTSWVTLTTRLKTSDKKNLVYKTKNYAPETSQALLDNLIDYKILDIPNDTYRGIGGHLVYFEVSTPDTYRVYSYWSPKLGRSKVNMESFKNAEKVANLLKHTYQILKPSENFEALVNSLTPGHYNWGMLGVQIEELLPDQAFKSSLYQEVEHLIKENFNMQKVTNRIERPYGTKFPLLLIDGKPNYLASLNQYEMKEVKKINVITDPTKTLLYGSLGKDRGIIQIALHEK